MKELLQSFKVMTRGDDTDTIEKLTMGHTGFTASSTLFNISMDEYADALTKPMNNKRNGPN